MKCISLWEPFASLMALEKKRIETRHWQTKYRGWLAIHSSKGGLSMADLEETCWQPVFREALAAGPEIHSWMNQRPDINGNRLSARTWQNRGAFPFGKIIAVVKLIHCIETDLVARFVHPFTEQEKAFGNYEHGRFAWLTEDLFRLPEPIPLKARQGLFDLPYDTVMELRRQYRAVHGAAGRGLVA